MELNSASIMGNWALRLQLRWKRIHHALVWTKQQKHRHQHEAAAGTDQRSIATHAYP
jgi:hypothetical protein